MAVTLSVQTRTSFMPQYRSLIEVLHCDRKLFLVFEYLDYDLKKYMDKRAPAGIPHDHVKVTDESSFVCLCTMSIVLPSYSFPVFFPFILLVVTGCSILTIQGILSNCSSTCNFIGIILSFLFKDYLQTTWCLYYARTSRIPCGVLFIQGLLATLHGVLIIQGLLRRKCPYYSRTTH